MFKKPTRFVQAVNDINLTIYRGETLGLVGESGCGKTTLGKSILQLVKPTSGEMNYDFQGNVGKKNLLTLNSEEMDLARKKMQIVFQDPHSSLNPAFTIYQSLSDPLKKFGVKDKMQRRMIIGDILEAVNMRREYMDRYPHEFSGGQRQRIGIARALCVNPELIICDESVSALDVSIQAQVLNLLKKIKEERNLTYIFITHDLSVVEYISDRIAVMYLGRIVELSDTEEVFSNYLHPYTEALLSAIPIADLSKKSKRIVLEGDVPSPVNPPSGCNFHPRCKKCMEICKRERPLLKKYIIDGKEHYVACHLADINIKEDKNE
ncbi:MAG: ATP-binding cassette domain-containing protein [Clostridium sp.]|nr:ATP-binding cassette domain-containing protein [Clostridium sp.]